MPITGLDRMPGSGLARGTLFDKELNTPAIEVITATVTGSIVLEKDGENSYTIAWTQPSGADRILSIPALGAADTFVFLTATQTITNKAFTGVTDFDMTSGDKTILDTIGSNSLTIGAGGTTVIIAGNLTVSGTTTTVNTTTLNIADSLYALNTDETGTPSQDAGFVVERGTSANVGFMWDESADEFVIINTAETGSTAGNVTISSYANFQAANIAGTLTTAAQGNVTSLGTLTALTVDDVSVDGKVVTMTGSSGDTAVFTVGTNGTLSIVTTDTAAAAANLQITADGTVDIDSVGVLTLDSGAAINLEPAAGSAILLDGTISVDAGVITGATSITSTAFVGTLSTAAQGNVTSLGTLTTLTIDNININGNTIISTDSNGDITLTPDGSGEVNIAAGNLNYAGTAITATGAELNLLDGGTVRGTTAVASGDGIVINDGGTMNMTNVDTVSTYFASHSVGGTNIVTTGALDAGSITSGFGAINTGSSNITTTGTITYGNLSDGSISVTAWVDEDDMSSNSATLIPTQQSVKAYVDGSAQTMGDGFVIEDDDGTEVTITENKEMKIIGSGVTINWTDTSTGSDGDPYDLTITVDAAQGNITSLGTLTALTVDDVVVDGKVITMTGDTSDTVVFTAGTNGTLSIVTTDAGGAAGNIQITADGTAELAGTTVTLDSAADIELEATDDINVPSAVGLTFADDGQKIESDGTDFTIASGAKLNLTATSDVHVANGTGVVVGHTAQVSSGGGGDAPEVQILGTAGPDSSLQIGRWSANASGPQLRFLKSRDPAIADGSFAIVVDGDDCGQIAFLADDGTDFGSTVADILAEIDGTPGENDTPGRILFRTTSDGEQGVTERMRLDNGGVLLLNDTATADVTTGICINQASADDGMLVFKSSDVAHAFTDLVEADTAGIITKANAAEGGILIDGFTEVGARDAVHIRGSVTSEDTSKSISRFGPIVLSGAYLDGNTRGDLPSDANIVAIRNNGTTRFLFDAEGDSHQDVGTAWTNFDDYDDVGLLHALAAGVSQEVDPIRAQFGQLLDDHREFLEEHKLATFNDDGHHFINWSRTNMLVIGAVRQQAEYLAELGAKLEIAERKLAALGVA